MQMDQQLAANAMLEEWLVDGCQLHNVDKKKKRKKVQTEESG